MIVGAHSLGQQLSLSIKKYTDAQIQKYTNLAWSALENGVDAWRESVEGALNIPIPKGMQKKRTTPRDRLFPYLRTGKLQDSVEVSLKQRKGREGSFTVYLSGKIPHVHGSLTNSGVNSDSDAGWIGWRDDVLSGDGRGNVKSLREVFQEIKQMRRG